MRRTALIALAVASVLLLACVAGERVRIGEQRAGEGSKRLVRRPLPVAVVLVQTAAGSELATVDLTRMRVIRRVRLRSLCLSIDGDPARRLVVTAQCGGPDRAADRVAGLYRPGEGGLTYRDLGVPNPLEVAVAGGRAFVLHGVEKEEGLVTTVLDTRGRTLVAQGSVGAGALAPVRWGTRIVLPVRRLGAGSCDIVDVGRFGSPRRSLGLSARTVTAVSSERSEGHGYLVYAASASNRARQVWRLAMIDASNALADEVELDPAPTRGALSACLWSNQLAVADADGVDMGDPGSNVRVYDLSSGRQVRALSVQSGMPAALATWDDRLLVVDGVSGDLLIFGAGAPRPETRVRLGGVPVGAGDIAVFP